MTGIVNESELKRLIADGRENLQVEYKSEISDETKLVRSVAAFANSRGGRLYIGIAEGMHDKPVPRGVKYNSIHNKDRIMNLIADNIKPKIPGLNLDVVPLKKRGTFVFIISIPATSRLYGVRDKGWKYYMRRSGRVEELQPEEIVELAVLAKDYDDNKKCREALLSAATAIKKEFARLLGIEEDDLAKCLRRSERFSKALLGSEMKKVSFEFLDAFHDLQDGIQYALDIPRGNLKVEEMECIGEIRRCINDYTPSVEIGTSPDTDSLERIPKLYYLSIIEWVKYAVEDMQLDDKTRIWSDLRRHLRSHGVTLGEFIREVRDMGVPFTEYYQAQFFRHVRRALVDTYRRLDELEKLLKSMQSKYGSFET